METAILERLASGETLQAIADSMPIPRPDGTIKAISRSFLFDFLNRKGYREAYHEAMKLHADAVVDQSIKIADETSTDVAYAAPKARNQIQIRQWVAGRLNREKWGEQKQVGVEVNIGALHLDALRKFGSPKALSGPQIEGAKIELADVEMIEAGSADDLTDSDPLPE